MIRILFIHNKDELKAYKTHKYYPKDFKYLVEGEPCKAVKEPPFRDEDSLKVLHEAARAEFVSNDWFSIVFEGNGRSCITAVQDHVQYILAVVANSRKKIYTSYECLGDDAWKILADLSVDALLYFNVGEFDVTYPSFEIPESVFGKVVIENHDFNGVRSCGTLADECEEGDRLLEDGELQVSNYFIEYCFDWSENIDLLLKKAEDWLYKSGDWYKHEPMISGVEEFAETLDPEFASAFYEHYTPKGGNKKRHYKVKKYLKNLQIHNYLYQIPTETTEKYPMYLVMTKDTETGACTIKMECGGKYPSFSDAVTESFVMPSDQGGTSVTLTVVIDSEVFLRREDSFKKAVWAFKYYDNIMELYDNFAVYEQLVNFLKQPYEKGLVTVVDWEGL